MKAFLSVICLLSAATVQAGEWEGMLERFGNNAERVATVQQTLLTSGGPVAAPSRRHTRLHANERACGAECAPIWKDITIYMMTDASPAEVAAIYADYANFRTHFRPAGLVDASIVSGSVPNIDVWYKLSLTVAGFDAQNPAYVLRNTWRRYTEGGRAAFESEWVYVPGGRNDSTHVYHVEGGVKIESVEVNGVRKTLVRYDNYVNPTGNVMVLGTRVGNVRSMLAEDEYISRNVSEATRMVRQLKTLSNNGTGRGLSGGFCSAIPGGCN